MPRTREDAERKGAAVEREEQRREYAKSLARDAFGRHYWDDGKAKELRRAAIEAKQRKLAEDKRRRKAQKKSRKSS